MATEAYKIRIQPTLIELFFRGLKTEYSLNLRLRELESLDQAKEKALSEEAKFLMFGKIQSALEDRMEKLLAALENKSKITETVNAFAKKLYCAICKLNDHNTDDCRRNPNNNYARFCQSRKPDNHNTENNKNNNSNNNYGNNNFRGENNTRKTSRYNSQHETSPREKATPCVLCSTQEHESEDCPKLQAIKLLQIPRAVQ